MNILMLNYEYPPLGGGAGQVTLNISERLAIHNNVYVVTSGFRGLPATEEQGNLSVYRLNSLRKKEMGSNPLEMLSWMQKCLRFCDDYLLKHDVDLVFAHFTLPGGEVALRLKRKHNIPYVIMSHGHDIPWFFPRQMFIYHLGLYFRIKRICKNASSIFLQTPEMKAIVDKFTGKKHKHKNIIIPNACDSAFFTHVKNRPHDKLRMVFTGRFVNQKQPLTIIQALALLKKRNIDFEMSFIGNGPLLKRMQKLIRKHHLNDKINIRGWMTLNSIKKEYKTSHLFLMPSQAEGMSIAIIEAMASGLYILITKSANKYELVKQNLNGFIIDEITPKNIAETIMNYYDNYFLHGIEIPDKTVEHLINIYNWKSIGDMYIHSLNNTL
ncbi:MAG: glycosyltransferase family 4 protein [Candidatus Delongbacteria bacterium]|jgi:glycosyltransferase involved in cell wall biosynthesis|nr:glycosyltransferase family 4 protein [Candidatus Delongbacteria bacterium]